MISVVIPLFNKEKDIRTTIRSVFAQSYDDYELVVVNDGSTDRSAEIVKEEMAGHSNTRLIEQANCGVSAARNRGILEARGEYVALIDGDDIWDIDCLKELAQMTHDFPEAAMCGVNYAYRENDKVVFFNQGVPFGFRNYVKDYFSSSHNDLFWSSSVILRRSVAISVGLFDERIRISEDLDFWYRIILNHPVAFNDKVFSCYNKDASNRAEENPNAHFEITKRMDYYIEKFEPYYAEHSDFAHFIGMRTASNILRGGYYFGNRHDRVCTNHIVRHLSYRNMPYKYRLIFQTPRPIGWCVYQLSLLYKRIFRSR